MQSDKFFKAHTHNTQNTVFIVIIDLLFRYLQVQILSFYFLAGLTASRPSNASLPLRHADSSGWIMFGF